MKKITVLGSTGSVGRQALSVLEETENVSVIALAALNNIDLLEQQIFKFKPEIAAVHDSGKALELKKRISGKSAAEVLSGDEGVWAAAGHGGKGLVINALVGFAGLMPTIKSIEAGKNIALANKETLVAGGELVMRLAKDKNVSILPVDSEHSAIFQCLQGNWGNKINRIFLTASGGPFRGFDRKRLANVTLEQALDHPLWSMGKKITVDSSTLMNKGLEVIEAKWLFDVRPEQIQVVVHPQGVIHSMVEYEDGAVIAQLARPDMRLPVQYAVNYPKRLNNSIEKMDIFEKAALTFERPDTASFPCLKYAYDALKAGGMTTAVLNAANEIAVNLFLNKKINYIDIDKLIEKTLLAYNVKKASSLYDIIETDRWARDYASGAALP